MKIITDIKELPLSENTAVAIGKFDGVHRGHRRILDKILDAKKDGLSACVFTFEPSPAVLFGFGDGKVLTTKEEKREILEGLGVDILVEFPLTRESAAMSPEDFVTEILVKGLHIRMIAAGEDISFGNRGAGNARLLMSMSKIYGFQVEIVDKLFDEGQTVSSTRIRELVEKGQMERAKHLLGRPYCVEGTVISGNHIGRTIGFPTANIIPEESKLLPPFGVYYGDVLLEGKKYHQISNIGIKPTVSNTHVCGLETYLYEYEGDIYGKAICVELQYFHRPEQKFESIEQLKKQLESDLSCGKQWQIVNQSM